MANWAWYLISAIGLAVVYDKYVTPEQKREWENKIKMHHGEAGALLALAGIFTESPRLTAAGLGLVLHDIKDIDKWFSGDKQGANTESNIVVPSSPFYVWNPNNINRI